MPNNIILLAETNFRNQRRRFGIKLDDRRRHMYLIGKTGMGKTTVLENMIIQDIEAGHGLAVVDPHGDLVEKIIDFVPPNRVNETIYFNPGDMDFPIAFNVLEELDPTHRHLVSSGLIGVFKKIWADSWGPRLEYVLRNAILALMDYPGSTLLGIMRILVDKGYRKRVIRRIRDPVVKSFWVEEFSKYPDRFQAEAIAPIQNKVGQFLSVPLVRNIVGQVKSTIDLRKVMDTGQILLLNLAKGRIGEDNSALMGAMMITKLQLAAMSRVDIPEEKRKDFYLYVDEFQNFATESFANILSEARKYRLNLILAHQYVEQLEEVVRSAVFGNVGTIMCFRIGAEDAEFLAQEFAPIFNEIDLVNLTKYDVYMKLMIDGVASDSFSASTLPPLVQNKFGLKETIIKCTRERYAKPRQIIEEKITRWSGVEIEEDKKGEEDVRSPSEPEGKEEGSEEIKKEMQREREVPFPFKYEAICWACERKTEVSFKPDQIRPVFCKECLKQVRKGEIKKAEVIQKYQSLPRIFQRATTRVVPKASFGASAPRRLGGLHGEPNGLRGLGKKSNPNSGSISPKKVSIEPALLVDEEARLISLKDALTQKPISFKKAEREKRVQAKTERGEDLSLERFSSSKNLKPGEVVRLDKNSRTHA